MFSYDIFSQICNHLNNKEKVRFTSISTTINSFKYRLIYTDQINDKRISGLSFYDNFESTLIDRVLTKLPKNVKKLHINCYNDCAIYTLSRHFTIPTTVTH